MDLTMPLNAWLKETTGISIGWAAKNCSAVKSNNYEVHCMPEIDDEPVVLFSKNNPKIDFKVWDPSTMQCLIKLPDFIEFIRFAFTRGDEIDQKLVRYAALTVDNILKDLATEIDIVGLKGYSINHIIERIEEEGSVE